MVELTNRETCDDASASTAKTIFNKHSTRETPKEMAARLLAERKTKLSVLDEGALYIQLYFRTGEPNNFHWALYHHYTSDRGGHKFHIVGTPGEPHSWYPDHRTTHDAMSDLRLIGLVRISGNLRSKTQEVERVITARDDQLPKISNITCRVYIQVACEDLKEAGLLNFVSWTELQEEIFAFANPENPAVKHSLERSESHQPRPVWISRLASQRP